MKILIVEERLCPSFHSFLQETCGGEFEYLGIGLRNGKIAHIVRCRGKTYTYVNPECRLAEALSKTAMLQTPEVRRDKIYLYLYYRSGVEKIFSSRRWRVVDIKKLRLTDRQLQVLNLYIRGGLRLVERELGIHKSTACRLAKRGLRKLILLHQVFFSNKETAGSG
jgi:hypothetical protein